MRRKIGPGSVIGHYTVLARTDELRGKNYVYKTRCHLCNRPVLRTIEGMERDHYRCFSFKREVPMIQQRGQVR